MNKKNFFSNELLDKVNSSAPNKYLNHDFLVDWVIIHRHMPQHLVTVVIENGWMARLSFSTRQPQVLERVLCEPFNTSTVA